MRLYSEAARRALQRQLAYDVQSAVTYTGGLNGVERQAAL
jgi:hypothetical protein